MKIVVAGPFEFFIYEPAIASGLEEIGGEVFRFEFARFFESANGNRRSVDGIIKRISKKYLVGPPINKLNWEFEVFCIQHQPDIVFIQNGWVIRPSTIRSIRNQTESKIVVYTNDNPYPAKSAIGVFDRWRHFKQCLPLADHVFAYRNENLEVFRSQGYPCSLMRSYWIKEQNFTDPEIRSEEKTVTFIGHYEPDGRDVCLLGLEKAGVRIQLYGTAWEQSPYFDKLNSKCGPIRSLDAKEYNAALNHADVALVFLSKLNRDQYTRRCFEIPATETAMVSEYSKDLSSLFADGEEAVFFRSETDLIARVLELLEDDSLRLQIARNGLQRLMNDGHELGDRVKEMWATFENLSGH